MHLLVIVPSLVIYHCLILHITVCETFGPFVFTEYFPQIDQKINELVGEQQRNDAKLAHEKSVLEQIRQDAMNAERQKQSISKSLEKKVRQRL